MIVSWIRNLLSLSEGSKPSPSKEPSRQNHFDQPLCSRVLSCGDFAAPNKVTSPPKPLQRMPEARITASGSASVTKQNLYRACGHFPRYQLQIQIRGTCLLCVPLRDFSIPHVLWLLSISEDELRFSVATRDAFPLTWLDLFTSAYIWGAGGTHHLGEQPPRDPPGSSSNQMYLTPLAPWTADANMRLLA